MLQQGETKNPNFSLNHPSFHHKKDKFYYNYQTLVTCSDENTLEEKET